MFNQDEEKKIPELDFGVNLMRCENDKCFKLPLLDSNGYFLKDGDTIELVLLGYYQISIESYERPIRYGKYYNNRIFFNTMIDRFSVNPKFVYDAKKSEWVLMNAGYACMAELEIEYRSNHKIFGTQNA